MFLPKDCALSKHNQKRRKTYISNNSLKQVDGSRQEQDGSHGKEFREDHDGDSSLGHTVRLGLALLKEETGNNKGGCELFSMYTIHNKQ